jgi:hypothetical protein
MSPLAPDVHCVSPGLALVDPELAAAARALLPEPGEFRPNWQESAIPAGPLRQRRRPVTAIVVAIAIIASIVGGGLGHVLTDPQPVGGARAIAAATQHAEAARVATAARTYRWPSIPGARSYDLRLRKGAKEVYRVTTTSSTANFPANLYLAAGRYTWSVTPNFGDAPTATTAPIVEGTFETTAVS